MPIFKDRRASTRQVINCPGRIVSDVFADGCDCVVADLSEGGVRLSATSQVPDEFILVIDDGTGARHKCRVVWRLDDEIGAEFI